MRLVSYSASAGAQHRTRVGACVGDSVVDLVEAFRAMALAVPEREEEPLDWLDLDAPWLVQAQNIVEELTTNEHARTRLTHRGAVSAVTAVRFAAPVPRPGKVICVGLNYRDHAAETGKALPERPILFSKFSTAVIGHEQPIVLPGVSEQVDYEAELGVVIGRHAKHLPRERALSAVAGYMNVNDVSARDLQFGDGQWQRGKSCDTFAPMGPYLVTAEDVPNPDELGIRLRLNGTVMQDSSTRNLVFGVADLIAFISESITLEPGDVIATGTPAGVGFARKPPVFLKPGDRVEVEVEGLGVLANPVVAEA
jgi:acylpyruvate hydrolase